MNKILRASLPMLAALLVTGFASQADAAWPRYRVNAGYSLPSVPVQRPQFVPVYPNSATVPGVASYSQPPYAPPAVTFPGAVPTGVPAANVPPSLLAPPNISVPNTTMYPPTYGANYAPSYGMPTYNAPTYNAPAYNPAPVTSYYNPPAYQPYQQPRPIQPYVAPVQPYGGYYQPTRPSTFYSPTPSYLPQAPVFGQY